jgi:hypothetical protein
MQLRMALAVVSVRLEAQHQDKESYDVRVVSAVCHHHRFAPQHLPVPCATNALH